MFEQGFTFKKGAWHARLMKYIWNLSHKDFDYMCPYFWLSVFNVIIAPVFVPVKFTVQTIFWRIFCKKLFWPFVVWNYEGIERGLEAMTDKLDAWALEQQRKWNAKREREIREFNGWAAELLSEVPDEVLIISQRVARAKEKNFPIIYYELSYKEEIIYRKFIEDKDKKFYKFWNYFLKLLAKEPDLSVKIVEDKKRAKEASYSPSIEMDSASGIFVVVPETEEQRIDRLAREQKATEEEEKRKAEKKAKEDEKERVKQLRIEEAAKREEERRRKHRIRQEIARNKRLRNKQRINKILKIVKPIGTAFIWIIGIAVAAIGLYFLMKGIIWIGESLGSVKQTTYNSIGRWIGIIAKWLGIVTIGVGTVIGIISGVRWLINNVKLPSIGLSSIMKKLERQRNIVSAENEAYIQRQKLRDGKRDAILEGIKNVFIAIGSIFPPAWRIIKYIGKFTGKILKLILVTPFVKIAKGIVVFCQIVKQTYNDNCPPIKWDD